MKNKVRMILAVVLLAAMLGGTLRMLLVWSQPEEPVMNFTVRRAPRGLGTKAESDAQAEKDVVPIREERVDEEISSEATPARGLVPGSCLFCLDNPAEINRLQDWAESRGIHCDGIAALGSLRMTLSLEDLEDLENRFPELASQGSQEGVFVLPAPPEVNVGGGENLGFYGTFRDFLGVNSQDSSRGQGVKIALIDTALLSHGDFEGLHVSAITLDGKNTQPFSYNGGTHATSVLSILAGNANGITSDATILSIPIVGVDGTAQEFDLASAIVLAVDNGADVISISLGGETGSPVLESAVRYATNSGVVIVASAGNDGVNRVSYPAAYSDVVAVGAVNRLNQYMDFSNSGENLNVVAPGVGLEAASADNEWTLFSGTSAAVPCVAGVIANYLSSHSQDTAEEAIQWLETTCTDIGKAGGDEYSGQGSVDAWLYENHDIVGLTDAALTALRVEATEDGGYEVVMNVQNTGTCDLDVVKLLTRIGKSEKTVELTDLKAFETMEVSLPFTPPTDATILDVYGMVVLPNATDLRSENQSAHAVLTFSQGTEE